MYTHVCRDSGNGLPQCGDLVLVDKYGFYNILKVKERSSIQTKQWKPNWIYLTLEKSNIDFYELSEDEKNHWMKFGSSAIELDEYV